MPDDLEVRRLIREVVNEMASVVSQQLAREHTLRAVWGVVTATNVAGTPPTVTVKLQGATTTTTLRYLKAYTPTVNDVVICAAVEQDLWVMGHMA